MWHSDLSTSAVSIPTACMLSFLELESSVDFKNV
jgi:hypothetical protein